MTLNDYLFRGSLAEFDPAVAELINLEAERQIRRLILIPSESSVPWAVREALSSAFHNIYAEGYPPEETRFMSEEDIMDVDAQLARYRRYSDPRYYKGTEFADIIEALARTRVAKLFMNERVNYDGLYVNVQPLSGAPANSAVYTALIQPGDTIMGMNLLHGGHLSHGSPVARSGKQYHVVFYGVHPETELIDYTAARELALQHKPKIIIAGYTSYPMAPDWEKFRQIADEVGAILLADIAHVAGLTIAGVFPSPVGIADVVSFTTHKTFGGPRGAVLLTHRPDIAKKIDRGVFPGEQGGPHMNSIAALAVAAKIAATVEFKELQQQTVANAIHLAKSLQARGIRVVHGGTDTHLINVDCKPHLGPDGSTLGGDMAARILDLVGITCNRNTLPSDDSAARPSGIRLGTPWITQRGFREPHVERLAEVIADVLSGTKPFSYDGKGGKADLRAKLPFDTYLKAQQVVAELCDAAGIDYELPTVGRKVPESGRMHFMVPHDASDAKGHYVVEVRGKEAASFLNYATTNHLPANSGEIVATNVLNADGTVLSHGALHCESHDIYWLYTDGDGTKLAAWLQALSDGFVIYDDQDLYGKLPGPVVIRLHSHVELPENWKQIIKQDGYATNKVYFVGQRGAKYAGPQANALPAFTWTEPTDAPLKQTQLWSTHKEKLAAKMVPFAGYDMPVWYKGVSQEHAAVRTGSGLFDVSHMGVWEVSGPNSEAFLSMLTTNDPAALEPGDAHYSYLLGLDGVPLDDIYIYRLEPEKFMIVVNASNNDKDWAWVTAVHQGRVQVDDKLAGSSLLNDPQGVTLRDLRAPSSGTDRRVDLALQGPKSLDLLLSLPFTDAATKAKLKKMGWSTVTKAKIGGFDLIVSRTGYTGERIAFELFVHPDKAAELFIALVEAGATPCGLAARDSLRTEAGLPLYGHELGSTHDFTPGDAGFASYVKLWKPFFIGKQNYLAREAARDSVITRFRINNKGVRPPQPGAAVVDRRGRVVGIVTSCSIDSEGYQTGQAHLKEEFAEDGTPIFIITSGGSLNKDSLKLGDKIPMPDAATVLTHFPVKKKS